MFQKYGINLSESVFQLGCQKTGLLACKNSAKRRIFGARVIKKLLKYGKITNDYFFFSSKDTKKVLKFQLLKKNLFKTHFMRFFECTTLPSCVKKYYLRKKNQFKGLLIQIDIILARCFIVLRSDNHRAEKRIVAKSPVPSVKAITGGLLARAHAMKTRATAGMNANRVALAVVPRHVILVAVALLWSDAIAVLATSLAMGPADGRVLVKAQIVTILIINFTDIKRRS